MGRLGWLRACIATLLWLCVMHPTTAALRTGTNEGAPHRFELAFVLWDPLAQTSYTLDLGVLDDAIFGQGQSDAGYQRFWTFPVANDPNLVRFRGAVTTPAQVRWGVLGFDDFYVVGDPGEIRIFTTLEQGTAQGVRNGNYTRLVGLNNASLNGSAGNGALRWLGDINTYTDDVLNTSVYRPNLTVEQNFAVNGSTFSSLGTKGYFAFGGLDHLFDCNCNVTNVVGKSSWFYSLSNSSANDDDKVLVDEFDNLSADGYWGLAIDPATSNYVLSYTLTPSQMRLLASTAGGRARAALTEYRAGEAIVNVVAPAGEFAGYTAPSFAAISPVPDAPALPMLLSGAAAAWVLGARRRRPGARDAIERRAAA